MNMTRHVTAVTGYINPTEQKENFVFQHQIL
jgi:hypothetical protein